MGGSGHSSEEKLRRLLLLLLFFNAEAGNTKFLSMALLFELMADLLRTNADNGDVGSLLRLTEYNNEGDDLYVNDDANSTRLPKTRDKTIASLTTRDVCKGRVRTVGRWCNG